MLIRVYGEDWKKICAGATGHVFATLGYLRSGFDTHNTTLDHLADHAPINYTIIVGAITLKATSMGIVPQRRKYG